MSLPSASTYLASWAATQAVVQSASVGPMRIWAWPPVAQMLSVIVPESVLFWLWASGSGLWGLGAWLWAAGPAADTVTATSTARIVDCMLRLPSKVERHDVRTIAQIERRADERRCGPRRSRGDGGLRQHGDLFRRHGQQSERAVLVNQDHLAIGEHQVGLREAPVLPDDHTGPGVECRQKGGTEIAAAADVKRTDAQHVAEVDAHLAREPELSDFRRLTGARELEGLASPVVGGRKKQQLVLRAPHRRADVSAVLFLERDGSPERLTGAWIEPVDAVV